MSDLYRFWKATRPPQVQALAEEFPIGSTITVSEKEAYYIIGYTEDDQLIISENNPVTNYDEAIVNYKYLCARHPRHDYRK